MKKMLSLWSGTLLSVAALLLLLLALSRVETAQAGESRRQLEESLRRSVVSCYATEGVYPPTLRYLQEHYGVQVDETRFAVDYCIFASNLMPEITVLEREQER